MQALEPKPAPWPALVALVALLLAGCASPPGSDTEAAEPRSYHEVAALISEIRAFERRIGFEETTNFRRFSRETQWFPFCGRAPRLYLPYSYEDPAIEWSEPATEEECRAGQESVDVMFGVSEAVAERDTPVTASMLAAPLERLVYLVIHEDCHEQFTFPRGIEEALCSVITYKAMMQLAEEKFAPMPREHNAIQRYARQGAQHARVTIVLYGQLATLYARHERKELPSPAALRARERIFRTAQAAFEWKNGSINHLYIANAMTYSRHYPFLEDLSEALGRDLARTVSFFKAVDQNKPSAAEVLAQRGPGASSGVDFIRAYEAAVITTIEKRLAQIGPHAWVPQSLVIRSIHM